MASSQIPLDTCARLIHGAAAQCATNAVALPPDLNALALATAQQTNLIGWIALLIAILGIFAGFTWGRLIEADSREIARKSAREWMDAHGTELVSEALAKITPSRPAAKADAEAEAEALAKDDPQ